MLKMTKFTIATSALAVLLTACGGGGGSGGSSGSGAGIQSLSLSNPNISTKSYASLAPSTAVTQLSFLNRLINFFLPSAYAVGEDAQLVTEDSSGVVEKIFSAPLIIKDFDLPSVDRNGSSYLVFSGVFSVNTSTGTSITCNLIAASITGDTSPKCIYSINSDESSTIPVATIRDGNVDGYLEDFDSIYFAINKSSQGFSVYKYDGSTVSKISTSAVGKITKIKKGDRGIFGYDDTLNSMTLVFGNNKRGLDITSDLIDRPLFYKGFALYPFRQVDVGSGPVDQSVFFDLNKVTTTTYVSEFSINCKTPTSENTSATHSYGVIWISSDNQRLCEAYELTARPEPIAFRILDTTGLWSHLKISNNVLVGIANFSGTTKLIIEDISAGLTSLGQTRSIDLTNDLASADLDSVSSIDYYPNGIAINGIKNSLPVVRYYNTTSKTFETLVSEPLTIIERVALPTGS